MWRADGPPGSFDAVLFDFGGVMTTSPFDAFNRFEAQRGLPRDVIRRINSTDPHANAWARLERNDVTSVEFDALFTAEAAAIGHDIAGADVLALLSGTLRPEMVAALHAVKAAGLRTACLTNNVAAPDDLAPEIAEVMALFDVVVESSKVGVRKPEPAFYSIACDALGVRPQRCVFLDDLGINLKPAAAMGMRTIKVTSGEQAVAELGEALRLAL